MVSSEPASAQAGPEQIDQLEPGAGEWQTEYFGIFGSGGGRAHAAEAMFGVSDRLAAGFEVEAEHRDGVLAFDTAGPKLLYRLTDEAAPIGLGFQVQAAFDQHVKLAEAEARLIAAVQNERWRAEANLMLRRSSGDGAASTGLAYAWSLQHVLSGFARLGIDGSGQSAPLWGESAASGQGQFAGPSMTMEFELATGREVETGLAYFRRLNGGGPAGTARMFVQLSF